MASFVKINDLVDDLSEGIHTLASDQLVVALSNTAPGSETSNPTADGNGVLANVTEVAYTNLSSRDITTSSSTQTSGTYTLVLTDLTLTASGTVADFRYVYIYNDTPTSPKADPIIAHYDHGSTVSLSNGESFTVNFGASLFSLA